MSECIEIAISLWVFGGTVVETFQQLGDAMTDQDIGGGLHVMSGIFQYE